MLRMQHTRKLVVLAATTRKAEAREEVQSERGPLWLGRLVPRGQLVMPCECGTVGCVRHLPNARPSECLRPNRRSRRGVRGQEASHMKGEPLCRAPETCTSVPVPLPGMRDERGKGIGRQRELEV